MFNIGVVKKRARATLSRTLCCGAAKVTTGTSPGDWPKQRPLIEIFGALGWNLGGSPVT